MQLLLEGNHHTEYFCIIFTITCYLSSPFQQVDLIVCCDSAPPGRLQQRSGRTGRHRPGRVVHLLLEGKEVEKYNSNKNAKAQVAVRFVDNIHLQCKVGLPCTEHSKGAVVHVAAPCANNDTCGMQAQHTMAARMAQKALVAVRRASTIHVQC